MSQSKNPEARDAMDAVRELLFGQKVDEIDSRFREQEALFKQALSGVEERIGDRLKSMESFFRTEIDSATAKIKAGSEKFRSEKEATSKRFLELNKRVDADFEQVNQAVTETRDHSRKELYSKFSELEQSLTQAIQNLQEHTKTEVEALRSTAADRQRMGDFMIDLGMRLQSDDLKQFFNNREVNTEENQVGLAG